MLDQLNIDPQTPLEVSTDGQVLVVVPATTSDEHHERLKAVVEMIDRQHTKALKRLAE
ncbi:MAG TPA: hypothetical protein VNH11_17190 [Pirellulales bacterium]|nr:hypothetical protein [Pirellulales bacterium]